MSAIVHYFAYGSNMNPARVAERDLSVLSAQGATLSGYSLAFNKVSRLHAGIAHANITFQRDQQVEGVLYELDQAAEILKMDVFEAAPVNYGRDVVWVHADGQGVWSWTYFANPAVLESGRLPSRAYLDHLLAGKDYLSDGYFSQLKQQPCAD